MAKKLLAFVKKVAFALHDRSISHRNHYVGHGRNREPQTERRFELVTIDTHRPRDVEHVYRLDP